MISKAKRGWIAAMIEGEGHITISKTIRGDNGKTRYTFQVNVDNTNPLIILELHRLAGGNVFEIKACGLGTKRVYRWFISGTKRVAPFIKLIRPYMITKTEQADVIIKNADMFKKNKKHDKEIYRYAAYMAMKAANYKVTLSEAFEKRNVQRLDGSPSQEVKIKSELIGNYESKPEAVCRFPERWESY